MNENRKIVSLCFLACGAVVGLLVRELADTIWVWARLPVPVGWILSPTDLIGVALGAAAFIALLSNTMARTFTSEVLMELSKVTWPERKETALSTGIVSILVGICAVVLFGFDLFWGSVVGLFYR